MVAGPCHDRRVAVAANHNRADMRILMRIPLISVNGLLNPNACPHFEIRAEKQVRDNLVDCADNAAFFRCLQVLQVADFGLKPRQRGVFPVVLGLDAALGIFLDLHIKAERFQHIFSGIDHFEINTDKTGAGQHLRREFRGDRIAGLGTGGSGVVRKLVIRAAFPVRLAKCYENVRDISRDRPCCAVVIQFDNHAARELIALLGVDNDRRSRSLQVDIDA